MILDVYKLTLKIDPPLTFNRLSGMPASFAENFRDRYFRKVVEKSDLPAVRKDVFKQRIGF